LSELRQTTKDMIVNRIQQIRKGEIDMSDKMNVLVVGSGGREDTLAWKLYQSERVDQIYTAPGNAGAARWGDCVDISAEDMVKLLEFAKENDIGLTLVGPEAPLVDGIVDLFNREGLRIFGPTKGAAQLEGSKAFAKDLMAKYGIPTGAYKTFEDHEAAKEYTKEQGAPIVIKADGLAAGKGAIVCPDLDSAFKAIDTIMVEKSFGDAGARVVVEEFLQGEEASILAFTDGETVLPMASSQDHKAVYDGDKGPNTGGMGAYSPAPVITGELEKEIEDTILRPTIKGMKAEGALYKGVLYAGLMITEEGPKVIEYNCRFGDPELQAVLPRMKTDMVIPVEACIDGTLEQVSLEWDQRAAVCVVMASGGYPGKYGKGKEIFGITETQNMQDVLLFHAGVVMGVTALGDGIGRAVDQAYSAVRTLKFEDAYFRSDIAHRALKRESV